METPPKQPSEGNQSIHHSNAKIVLNLNTPPDEKAKQQKKKR